MTKTPFHTRFSDDALGLLRILADKRGVTMTDILEMIIRDEARRKRVKYDPDHPAITAAKKEKQA